MSGRIATVEAFEIIVPLPRPLRLAAMVIPHREYVVGRVRDENDAVGTAIGLTRGAPVAATVLRTVAPHLAGGCLDSYPEMYRRVVAANVCLGTNGVFWRALSLADCAVHDLLARQARLSLAELLGGCSRPVPCLLVGGYPRADETPASLGAEMLRLARFQPAGIKIVGSGDLDRDTERLAACRAAIPGGPPLMIDLCWQYQSAGDLLGPAAWSDFRLGWIEDPVAFDDYRGAALLAARLPFPVAIGDEQSGLLHFERLMDQGRVGIIRLDATVCGGVTGFRAIARAAAERHVSIACHVFAEMHVLLAALAPNVSWVEMFPPDGSLDGIHLLTRSRLSLGSGCLPPSTTPGLGFAWDEEALRHYRSQAT